MNTIKLTDVNNSFIDSSQRLWNNLIDYLPNLLLTIVVLLIGLILASILGSLVTKLVRKLRVDKILTTLKIKQKLEELDIDFSISGILGWLVKWFIIIATIFTVADMLKLQSVSEFLSKILTYIPNVLIAIIILALGLIIGNFISELVGKSIRTSDLINYTSTKILQAFTKWIIILFALMAALTQLNIASDLIKIFFFGVVVMFSLAGGIAFGLGGKEKAKELIDKMFEK